MKGDQSNTRAGACKKMDKLVVDLLERRLQVEGGVGGRGVVKGRKRSGVTVKGRR